MRVDWKAGFRIDAWEVRPLEGDLAGHDESVHLEPKVMEVLVALAEHAGQVVEREALLQRVWGTRAAVSDEPLTRCIAELRRAFGDSRQSPKYIQTVPKRGYRLLATVAPLAVPAEPPAVPTMPAEPRAAPIAVPEPAAAAPREPTVPAPPPQARARPVSVWPFAAVVLVAVAVVAGVLFAVLGSRPESGGAAPRAASLVGPTHGLAVFAFDYDAGFADDKNLDLAVPRNLLETLAETFAGLDFDVVRGLQFAERGGDERSTPWLGVSHVVKGTIGPNGDGAGVRLHLFDAVSGREVWRSENFAVSLSDNAEYTATIDEMAGDLLVALGKEIPGLVTLPDFHTMPRTLSWEANNRFNAASSLLHRRDADPLLASIALFEEAIVHDPSWGEPYLGLAKAYALLPAYSPLDDRDEMYALAERTLALGNEHDPSIAGASHGLRALMAYANWDWSKARREFDQALKTEQDDVDVLVWYSQFLASTGFLAESAKQAQRAVDIDGKSPVAHHRLALALLWIGENERARASFETAEALGIGESASPLGEVVLRIRLEQYDRVRELLNPIQGGIVWSEAWAEPFVDALESPALADRAIAAIERVEAQRELTTGLLFGAWLYLDEPERAFAAAMDLARYDPHSMYVEFLFAAETATLRALPQFGELARQIGLVYYWNAYGWPAGCREKDAEVRCE